MAKVAKKRPAGSMITEGEAERNAKNPKTNINDDGVEEFFALIRRIRTTAKLIGSEKASGCSRLHDIRWEDFVGSLHAVGSDLPPADHHPGETGDAAGKKAVSIDREKQAKEENGRVCKRLSGCLDLNADPGNQSPTGWKIPEI